MRENQMVKPALQPAIAPLMLQGMTTCGDGIFTSIQPTCEADEGIIINSCMSIYDALADHDGKVILVENVLCHETVSPNQRTGEPERWMRTVLFTPEGKGFECGSVGVLKSLYLLSRKWKPLPWKPPLALTVRTGKTNDGNNWMWVELSVEHLKSNAKEAEKPAGPAGKGK
jgi:hypothetical protein